MALTVDVIKQQEPLKGLSEDQLSALVTLSVNDENRVIGEKIKEVHTRYDQDIKELTGRDKPAGVHTYDHLKEVLKALKEKADKTGGDLEKQLNDLRTERDSLIEKAKEGAGTATKEAMGKLEEKLKDADARIKALQQDEQRIKGEYEGKLKEAEASMVGLKVDHEFQKALSGVHFKPEDIIPVTVRETYIGFAKQKILGQYTPDLIEVNGEKKMVFRDKGGMIVNNPNTLQNPYTPQEILLNELKEIVDTGHKQPGGGTGPGAGGGGAGAVVISSAKSQVEADRLIRGELAKAGLSPGTAKFQEELNKAWESNKVSALPLK